MVTKNNSNRTIEFIGFPSDTFFRNYRFIEISPIFFSAVIVYRDEAFRY